jgi:hypothetical protein
MPLGQARRKLTNRPIAFSGHELQPDEPDPPSLAERVGSDVKSVFAQRCCMQVLCHQYRARVLICCAALAHIAVDWCVNALKWCFMLFFGTVGAVVLHAGHASKNAGRWCTGCFQWRLVGNDEACGQVTVRQVPFCSASSQKPNFICNSAPGTRVALRRPPPPLREAPSIGASQKLHSPMQLA